MHEDLADAGVLSEFDESLGKAIFVSHQWLSDTHPDPDFQQLKVLQDALKNIVAGTSSISQALFSEIVYGRRRGPAPGDFAPGHLHIWYDYFSIPQSRGGRASQARQTAIQSIPTYVARCEFFVVLCPALKHRDQKRTLSHATWGERGWCRTERAARELSNRKGGYVIIVESATHQSLLWAGLSMRHAPGEGDFTLDGDRVWIGRMVTQMVWSKLFYYLEHRQFHNYRFLLNAQGAQYFRALDVEPIDGLVPGFDTEIDPSVDYKGFMLEHFLHQNGLRNMFERDAAGWPPICFAAMSNNVVVLQALLDRKVDINQATTKPKAEASFPGKVTPLGVACFFRNNEAVELLLRARAHVNYKDAWGGGALHPACAGDNPLGVRLLCHARANVNQQAMPGMSPFMLSCVCGSRRAMKEMLTLNPDVSLRHCLHVTLMFASCGSADLVSVLLQARANVNEQFRVQIQEPGWWLLMNAMGVKHRVSPSRLTLLAYHHYDATPLMFSILSGSLDSVSSLLSARARLDIRNYRKQTACELARKMLAPSWLIEACSTTGQQDAEILAEGDTYVLTLAGLVLLLARTMWDIIKYDYIGYRFLNTEKVDGKISTICEGFLKSSADSAACQSLRDELKIPPWLHAGSLLAPVFGILGFVVLAKLLWSFVELNRTVAQGTNQDVRLEAMEADATPWKLAPRLEWVIIILGTPLIFIVMSMRSLIRIWTVMTGSAYHPGADWDEVVRLELATYQMDLELSVAFQFYACLMFGLLCTSFLRHSEMVVARSDGSQHGSIEEYMRPVAYASVQGVYAFVFIGVLRTVFDITVTYLSEMPEYHEKAELIQNQVLSKVATIF
ncbi:Ankrd17, partial [Symbiodinium sp. CCMP2456]